MVLQILLYLQTTRPFNAHLRFTNTINTARHLLQSIMQQTSIPWVEQYRPDQLANIVMDPMNRIIFDNIVSTGRFPNLLLFGPPGTGKTTTIINLIHAYQEAHYGRRIREMVIHLNASDDRGIDVIRTQISQFVHSKAIFGEGFKFVIFDEIDYMTDTAQRILRHMMQEHLKTVRFCLVCNYMSRIDAGLKTECVKLRFNQLPSEHILRFLRVICDAESVDMSDATLRRIQKRCKSDMRSMLNFMQVNHITRDTHVHIVDDIVWERLATTLQSSGDANIERTIRDMCDSYNMEPHAIVTTFVSYLFANQKIPITSDWIDDMELAVSSGAPETICMQFISTHLQNAYKDS
jgi:DNA polymerase III gamma/tau subunit